MKSIICVIAISALVISGCAEPRVWTKEECVTAIQRLRAGLICDNIHTIGELYRSERSTDYCIKGAADVVAFIPQAEIVMKSAEEIPRQCDRYSIRPVSELDVLYALKSGQCSADAIGESKTRYFLSCIRHAFGGEPVSAWVEGA